MPRAVTTNITNLDTRKVVEALGHSQMRVVVKQDSEEQRKIIAIYCYSYVNSQFLGRGDIEVDTRQGIYKSLEDNEMVGDFHGLA